ncbi:RHS repeat-associated core domain-containing protein [Porticoccus sp. GXU_MW_L64]
MGKLIKTLFKNNFIFINAFKFQISTEVINRNLKYLFSSFLFLFIFLSANVATATQTEGLTSGFRDPSSGSSFTLLSQTVDPVTGKLTSHVNSGSSATLLWRIEGVSSSIVLHAQIVKDTSSAGDFSTFTVVKAEPIPPGGVPVGSGLVSGINLSGLTSGQHRYAYVCIVQSAITGNYLQIVDGHYVTVAPPPPVPGALTVPSGDSDGSYTVSWGSSSGATSYSLQRRLNGGSWVTLQNNSATSRSESGLSNGTYEYRVNASNNSGSSAFTSIKKTDVAITPGIPSSISNPSVSYTGNFTVSWGAASGSITKYDLNKRFNGGSWSSGYDGTSTSKAFSGQAAGNHEYAVRACKTTGSYTSCSAWRYSNPTNVVPPSTPGTPSAPTSSSNGAYTVSWGVISGANTYELQRQINGAGWTTVQNIGATSRSEAGLSNGTYGYRVRACSSIGCSPYSGVDSTDVAITPGIPASITTPGISYSGTHTVSWGTSSGSITKYDLNKRFNGGSWASGYDGTSTSKVFSGLTEGNYQYAVRACKTTGSFTSCSSWRYSGTAVVSSPSTPSTPNAPSNSNDGAYSVTWGTVTGATSYELQRRANGGSWSTLQTNSSTSRSESGLGSATYGYRVRACSAVGCSAYSAVDTTYVAIAPSVPSSISTPSTSYSGSHSVSWGSSSGSVTAYELYQQKDGGSWVLKYSGAGTSATLNNLTIGTYAYRVRARKTVGTFSAYSGYRNSNSSMVTTPSIPGAPSAPSGVSSSSISLSWGAVTGASHYLLTRTGPGGLGTITVSGTSLTDNGPTQQNPSATLTEGTYTYTLKACSNVGCSNESASVQVLVDYVPDAPPYIDASSHGALIDEDYTILWGEAAGVVTYYELQENTNGPIFNISSGTTYTTSKSFRNLYHYRVRACNSNNCSDWQQFASVRIHELLNTISPPLEEVNNLTVGSSPYEASVTPGGNASLSIPIKVAPGVNGLQPNFSISYLSGASGTQGLVDGMPEDVFGNAAWSLNGISAINKCRTGISLPDPDGLCLDGEPLVVVQGTFGSTGAIYRTLKESFVRIEQKEIAGRAWYEAKFPDGRVAQYGATTDSYVANKLYDPNVLFFGAVTQWSVNKVTDAFGNDVDYTYNHAYDHGGDSIGNHYLLSAAYDNAVIEFGYEWYGSSSETPPISLRLISIYVDNIKTREYRLIHDGGNEKIQECGYSEQGVLESCFSPLVFSFAAVANPTPDYSGGLSEVIDGLGVRTEFTYSLLSATGSQFSERPFGTATTPTGTANLADDKHVVTELRQSNGLGGDFVTNYAYHGDGLNSTENWGFLGFYAQRVIDQQSGIVTYMQRHLGDPLYYGEISAVHQYDGIYGSHTEVLSKVESQYTKHTITHGNNNTTEYAYGNRTTIFAYESGQLLGATEETNTYNFLNGFIDTVDTTISTAESVSSPSFSPAFWGDVATHSLNNVINTSQTNTGFSHRTSGSQWLVGFADAVSSSNSDGSDTITGDATFTPHSSSLRIASATRFPNHARLTLNTSYGYDTYGNVTSTTVNGDNVPTRSSSASNFLNNRYPQSLQNAEGHNTTINSYDLRFGTAKQVTDVNGEVVSEIRDAHGRVTSATGSTGVVTTSVIEYCNGSCGTVSDGSTSVAPVFKVTTDSGISPQTIAYYDLLGRVIRTEVEAYSGSNNILRDTFYDNQGRVAKSSLPYYENATPEYLVPSYDLRDRIIGITRPDGGSTATTYTVNGGANRVIVTVSDTVVDSQGNNPEVQVKRSEFDLLSRLMTTTDAHGSSEATSISYTYWPDGTTKTATVNGGSDGTTTTSFEYDEAGNRTKLTGPNVGVIDTTYTALGQVDTVTDNKSQATSYGYDLLGRVTSRTDADGTSNWVWDSATNGTGYLASRTDNNGFSESYTYQYLSGAVQLTQVDTNITGVDVLGTTSHNYVTTNTYDNFGRPDMTSYPAGMAVKRVYNGRGYLQRIENNSTGAALQTFNSADAFGNVIDESYGNGVGTLRTYDPESGRLTDIDTTNGSTVLQNLEYKWRSNGTLESRAALPDTAQNTTRREVFEYDALNRITEAASYLGSTWQRDLDYQYNRLGNLIGKTSTQSGDTDVTSYSYGNGISTGSAAGPHAVTSATIDGVVHNLTYDANGAVTVYDRTDSSTLDKYIEYNASSQPTKIVVGTGLNDPSPEASDEFLYGPDGSRYFKKSTYQDNGQTKTEYVFYVGDYEHSYTPDDNDTQEVHKTSIGSNILHMEILHQSFAITTEIEYLHRDHLGSVDTITDENGNLLQRMAFEPFGSRKDSDWFRNIDTSELDSLLDNLNIRTSRGFTGHEHLDRTGFIHMNGRVYDPVLGRFLSPDPYVQLPASSQNWNRYSYVLNNPMSFVDPSGFRAALLATGTAVSESTGSYSYTYISGYRQVSQAEEIVEVQVYREPIYNSFDEIVGYNTEAREVVVGVINRTYQVPIYKTVIIPKAEYASHTGLADTSRTVDFSFAGFDISVTERQLENALEAIDLISTGLDVLDTAATVAAVAQAATGVGSLSGLLTYIAGKGGKWIGKWLLKKVKKVLTDKLEKSRKVWGKRPPARNEGEDLFRVVDDVELADIKKTGGFRTAPGSFEGKQFVDNIDDAKALQKKFSEFFGGNQTIVRGQAPKSVLDNASKTPFSDIPNGTAITVPIKDLPKVKPKL